MTEESICPVCKMRGEKNFFIKMFSDSSMRYNINCPRCGQFIVSQEFLLLNQSQASETLSNYRHLLSGIIRESYIEKIPEIYVDEWKSLLNDPRVPADDDIRAKADKILIYLRKLSVRYGKEIAMYWKFDLSVAYAKNHEEFFALIELLSDDGFLVIEGGLIGPLARLVDNSFVHLKLTAKGWQLSKELGLKNINSEQCFIAIRFENYNEQDDIQKCIAAITQGIIDAGYKAKCIKGAKDYSETIMNKALSEIRKSRIVIVDLTGQRMAVSFEAGFAFALGIDAIYLCKMGSEAKNFYAGHYPILNYSSAEELRSIVSEAIISRYPPKKLQLSDNLIS